MDRSFLNRFLRLTRRALRPLAALLWAFIAVMTAPSAAALDERNGAELRGVRFGVTSPQTSRIVIDLSGAPVFSLSGGDQSAGAQTGVARLDIAIENLSAVNPQARQTKGRGHAAAAQYLGGDRPVLSVALKRSARVVEAFIIPPSSTNPLHRLVIDLETADKKAFLASLKKFGGADARPRTIEDVLKAASKDAAPRRAAEAQRANIQLATPPKNKGVERRAQAEPQRVDEANENADPKSPTLKPRGARSPAIAQNAAVRNAAQKATDNAPKVTANKKASREKRVIVIDAGHGGRDPGAIGVSGLYEKTVTFAASEQLRKILAATGRYDVVLTRTDDTRLAHVERTRIAREAGADLFISIHADAIPNKKVRGASIYTLSKEGTARSAEEARADGDLVVFDTKVGQDEEVQNILFDLAQQHTENESDRFAETLIDHLGGVAPLLNNTHREANFAVLLAPDVPAVLLELGFMSNEADEKNLKSPAWRRKTMAAVARSIDAYFSSDRFQRQALAR
ncbi:MAG: N-acetylmuramoyl-L-alanine amidase [Pseudomonadota bacterium]